MQIYADVYKKMAFAIYVKNNMYRKSHFSIYDLIPEIYSGERVTHWNASVVSFRAHISRFTKRACRENLLFRKT